MLQARWTESGLDVQDVDPPPLPADWVRLRVAASGICGSDLHAYRREMPSAPGTTPGHEMVGTVLEGGAGLADQLYAVEPHTFCGTCDLCLAGNRHLCPKGEFIGIGPAGGLAEFVDVPRYTLHPVDPSVSPLAASIAEPLAVCVRGVGLARLAVESRVLVLGAGAIGLLAGLVARDRAAEVAITARYPHQREAARRIGLTPLAEDDLSAWARERAPDAVIETVGGAANTLDQAVDACRPAGRVVILGIFLAPPSLNAISVVVKELEIVGSIIYGLGRRGSEFRATVSLLPRYREEIEVIQTHHFPLTSLREAFACANNKKTGAIKVTVLPK
ncbi:MAG: alcohol dehydrogenase catalytic domain-containing protein [Dehalococcoidia bacterium]